MTAVLALLAALCALLTYVLILPMMPLFRRYTLARPNARSSHRVPTPQGGGAAVVVASLTCLLAAATAIPQSGLWTWPLACLGLGVAVLAAVGALDDFNPLPVLPRLCVQGLAAAGGVFAASGGAAAIFGLPSWLVLGLALIGLIWFINLTNFMDGIDGITVAEFVPLTAGLAVLSVVGLNSVASGWIAAVLGGGLLGFAPFNRHAARLFLGDVGSLAIGLVVGVLLLELAFNGHVVAALILPLYYLADATLTLLRRLRNGERITEAHRSHFYQRATDLGWRVPQITGLIATVNVGLCALAVASAWETSALAQLAALAGAIALTAWLLCDLSREPRR